MTEPIKDSSMYVADTMTPEDQYRQDKERFFTRKRAEQHEPEERWANGKPTGMYESRFKQDCHWSGHSVVLTGWPVELQALVYEFAAISGLTAKQERVLKLRLRGHKLNAIGAELGCSGSNVDDMVMRAVRRVGAKMQEIARDPQAPMQAASKPVEVKPKPAGKWLGPV